MSNRFDYLTERIKSAEFTTTPFRHVYIEGIFSDEDFADLVNSWEIGVPPVNSDEELIDELHERNFKEISFPGTTTDIPTYLNWHKDPDASDRNNVNADTTEGFGVTLRLQETQDGTILNEITKFFESQQFLRTIAEKFSVDLSEVYPDAGLQKYLDGYEISPHPDIRRKALTYMINVNPADNSEELNIHTHYMKLKRDKAYVQSFWEGNPEIDTCWVPWDWCETVARPTTNNAIVIFEPSYDTLHAVRASYDHLATQRTQFYGNLWFSNPPTTNEALPDWRDFVITQSKTRKNSTSFNRKVARRLPFKKQLRSLRGVFR